MLLKKYLDEYGLFLLFGQSPELERTLRMCLRIIMSDDYYWLKIDREKG
jgi:hypothetical protein